MESIAPNGFHSIPWAPIDSFGFPSLRMGPHGFPWSPIARHGLQCSPWDSMAPDQIISVRTFTYLLFGLGLLNCKSAQPYLPVFEFGMLGLVAFECAYAKTIHVRMHLVGACLLPKHDWPGLLQNCGICRFFSRICAVWDRCFGFLGVDVLGTCVEQLHWAATKQSLSSCIMASILWLDVQSSYLSDRFSEALSGMSGRRASVLQALLSAYLHSANSLYTLVSIKICDE